MYARTAAFDAAIVKSHKIATLAQVFRNGVALATLKVVDGNVTADKDAAFLRRFNASLTDVDGSLTPAVASDMLAPYGTEVQLSRGITFNDGTQELKLLGVFNLTDTTIEDSGDSIRIDLQGYDRSRRVSRSAFTDTYDIPAGTLLNAAIQNILTPRLPSTITFNFTANTVRTPHIVHDAGDDPWHACQKLASDAGYFLFFDASGNPTMIAEPNPDTSPVVWTYAEGSSATILSVNKNMTDELTYNHVIVTGESSSNTTPVRGLAKDLDPNSPTYYLGSYGDIVYRYTSPFITTSAQAVAAAQALLNRVLGSTELTRFNAIPNPCHEVGDVVQITRGKSRINARYIMDKFTIPLVPIRAMEVTTRKRRT